MNLFKQNGYWWVNFKDQAGRRVRKPTGVRVAGPVEQSHASTAAAGIIQAHTSAPIAGTSGPAPLSLGFVLQRTYKEHWAQQKQARVIYRTCNTVCRDLGGHLIHTLDYALLKDYATRCMLPPAQGGQGLAPATVNRRMSLVSFAMGECARRKEIAARPEIPRFKENNKRERYVSPEEEQMLLTLATRLGDAALVMGDTEEANGWLFMRALIVVLLDTGLRFSELFVADFKDGTASLQHGMTKSDEGRTVPLTARARMSSATIERLRGRIPEEEKRRWDWCSHRFGRLCRMTDVQGVTMHTLRHTCASRLVQRGVSLYVVKEILGHSSITVTERYAHLAPQNAVAAIALLEAP